MHRPLVLLLLAVAATIGLTAIVTVALPGALPADAAWRARLLGAKLRGDLAEISVVDLVRWSLPGSPVRLEGLAEVPNVHVSIRNPGGSAADARRGEDLYLRHCTQCHGARGRGNVGPDLVESVRRRSDWGFLSVVLHGRPGTSMPASALPEVEIWRIHSWLRGEALGAATVDGAPARTIVDVPGEAIVEAERSPEQWLTYAGNYQGHRHSPLAQITPANVSHLTLAWVAHLRQIDRDLQVSPIVAGRTMYVSEARGGVVALDAGSGQVLWAWRPTVAESLSLCCGAPNRGVAIVGRTVFVNTIDAYLVALDANTGTLRWRVRVADAAAGYSMTAAPLALADRIVVGVAGGEFGVRGFVAAYHVDDGRLLWRFDTVPAPGEPGHDTWAGDSWRTGGAPTWVTGAYDAAQDLVLWGTGNPAPVYRADVRAGDNLYSNSVIALDAKTGRLRWHYQFTPGDTHDWDSAQQPVLADIDRDGVCRQVVLWPNRNGFFYALDRRTGAFLFARPFVTQNWNGGFNANGRPQVVLGIAPSAAGTLVWPAPMSAAHWWPPSYDPARQTVFVPSSDAAALYFRDEELRYRRGARFEGGAATPYSSAHPTRAEIKAIDANTGEIRWRRTLGEGGANFVWTVGGVLSTRSGVVFAGYRDGFHALDADSGRVLWRVPLGARVRGSPISFAVDGRQHVVVAAGNTLFAFVAP
jgi:alcohol dehydrogenase (cytochrome c)